MSVEINQLGPEVWEQRLITSAPPAVVFEHVADFERHLQWERELLSVRPPGRRLATVGAQYVKTYGTRPASRLGRVFSRGFRVTCVLKVVEPPQRIVWKQYRAHDVSGPSTFQDVEFVVTPSGVGSLVVVIRRLRGMEGSSVDLVARFFSSQWGQSLQHLPARPGMFLAPDEYIRRALDGYASRGPGPSSLERLGAVLDGRLDSRSGRNAAKRLGG
ncbi:SRPBCC family protein [Mycobacterium hubeiense]|uniref:SRPBCC family protein n=1 Tax=Mycobacterium hubeiense TaxID=1867256 RepID=UPI000C7F0321|nr:SRPBCC family protein [Mycobacterium sp. QGD 101]